MADSDHVTCPIYTWILATIFCYLKKKMKVIFSKIWATYIMVVLPVMPFPPKISNTGQYRNKSVISVMLFFH